jgi:hypothetical protein
MVKLQELLAELRLVLTGKGSRSLDSLIPLLLFLLAIPLVGNVNALLTGCLASLLVILFRLFKRDPLVYALGGLGSVLLAWVFIRLSGTEAGFVLPGLISSAFTIILCVISVMVNRPLVAWTSYLVRRWPLNWYWHPRILPAYNEVTIGWAVLFALRLALKYWFYQQGAVGILSWLEIVLGWPFTISLLVLSYLYGRWRLVELHGPSTEEFKVGTTPPWEGQHHGF